ncbi:hypothetical protein CCP3SC15_810012 [Gammaproteobacteria bacterium]
MKDLIRTISNLSPSGTTAGGTYQNAGSQHGNGFELEVIKDIGRTLRLTGNYAYRQTNRRAC